MPARSIAASALVAPVPSIDEAVASTRLEGLEPTREFFADAAAVEAGEFDADELVARAIARHHR
jgi:hypothetical protein